MGDLVDGDAVTLWWGQVPDPVPHILHPHQRVLVAHPTPGLPYGLYTIQNIEHDPQGDMVRLIERPELYWLWRFEPIPRSP